MRQFLKSEHGSAGAEYALLLALFAGTVAMAAIGFSDSIANSMHNSAALFASNDSGDHGAAAAGEPTGPGTTGPGAPGTTDPGAGGDPPGHSEPPGNSGDAPGHSEPPGNSGDAPGHSEPPGNSGDAPGHTDPPGNGKGRGH